MIGADTTKVLDPEADEIVDGMNEILGQMDDRVRQPEKWTPAQLNDLFYSCLRGYGWKG